MQFRNLKLNKVNRQRGITLIQILLASVVGAALTIASIRAAQGQKSDAEFAASIDMMTAQMPAALASYYEISRRVYNPTGATPATVKASLESRGVPAIMPWGGATPTWAIANLAAQAVTVDFNCAGALRGAGCAEAVASINAIRTEAAAFNTATRGITAPAAIQGTGAAQAVRLVYGIQG